MSWLKSVSPSSFEQAFSLRPNLFVDYREFARLFDDEGILPRPVRDLAAQRVATLLQTREVLGNVVPPPALQPGTALAACADIAELFVQDPQSITDVMVETVREHWGDAVVVALMEWLALLDGFCRFRKILELDQP